MDCLLKPILAYLRDSLLPQLPGLVFGLGLTFHHLRILGNHNVLRATLEKVKKSRPIDDAFWGTSLCQEAKEEVRSLERSRILIKATHPAACSFKPHMKPIEEGFYEHDN